MCTSINSLSRRCIKGPACCCSCFCCSCSLLTPLNIVALDHKWQNTTTLSCYTTILACPCIQMVTPVLRKAWTTHYIAIMSLYLYLSYIYIVFPMNATPLPLQLNDIQYVCRTILSVREHLFETFSVQPEVSIASRPHQNYKKIPTFYLNVIWRHVVSGPSMNLLHLEPTRWAI